MLVDRACANKKKFISQQPPGLQAGGGDDGKKEEYLMADDEHEDDDGTTRRGAFGVVTVAWSDTHSMRVASKSIRTSSPACVLNELQCLDKLQSSTDTNVIPLLDASRTPGKGFVLLFPYIEHVSFRDLISTIKVDESKFYMKSLLTALAFVHSHGIVHRDIKPANFLFSRSQRRGWLVDFGLAQQRHVWHPRWLECQRELASKSVSRQQLSRPRPRWLLQSRQEPPSQSGTPGYKAPETLCQSLAQGSPIDIFGAGIIPPPG
jgi:cell division control protein 7